MRDLTTACVALAVLGALVSTYYPLVHARAYASLPGHPGVVNAISSLFAPCDLAVPLAIGLVAERAGSEAALGVLAFVPVVMAAIGVARRRDAG